MQSMLPYWKMIYDLAEEEAHRLDFEGLEVMASALTHQEQEELTDWLTARGGVTWCCH